MIWRASSTISAIVLLIPMTQCNHFGSAPASVICPPELPPPPHSVLDSLDNAAASDPEAKGWVVDLEKQYQYQDAARPYCAPRT